MVCKAFEVSRSSYYDYRRRRSVVDAERVVLRADVNRIFRKSRSSAGSRMITSMLNDEGVEIGRFKVRRLMSELGLICKQPAGPTLCLKNDVLLAFPLSGLEMLSWQDVTRFPIRLSID